MMAFVACREGVVARFSSENLVVYLAPDGP